MRRPRRVSDRGIARSSGFGEPSVLWSDARIVESRRDRMRVCDQSLGVLQDEAASAVKDSRVAGRD